MGLVEELEGLQKLRENGALTEDEFATAKAHLISRSTSDDSSAEIDELRRSNAIAELDREWAMERENYMISGRYGRRYLPTTGGSVVGAVVISVFALVWMLTAWQAGAPGIFPLFGVIFIVAGIGSALNGSSKAQQYRDAESRYQSRRAELMSRR